MMPNQNGWIKERNSKIRESSFNILSEATYEDLAAGERNLNKEYQKYEPPRPKLLFKNQGKIMMMVGLINLPKLPLM